MELTLIRLLPLLLFVPGSGVGCGRFGPAEEGDADPDADTDADPNPCTDLDVDEPTITAFEAVVDGNEVSLTVDPACFELSDAIGQANVAGQGHIHFYDGGNYVAETATRSYTLGGLASGIHTMRAILSDNLHGEIGAAAEVDVTLCAPRVSIDSPRPDSHIQRSSVDLRLAIEGLTVVPPGTEDVDACSGYYNVYFDHGTDGEELINFGIDPNAFTVPRLSAGTHDLRVRLVDTNGMAFDPDVTDEITLTVDPDPVTVTLADPGFEGEWNSATLPVHVTTPNFTVDDTEPNGSHYHILVDGVDVGDGPSRHEPDPGFAWATHLSPGLHLFMVQLAGSDHTLDGPKDWHWVTVAETRPDVIISSPLDGAVVSSDFTVSMTAENVGEPVYRLSIDNGDPLTFAESTANLIAVESGTRELRVELVHLDRTTVYDPRVLSFATLTVVP